MTPASAMGTTRVLHIVENLDRGAVENWLVRMLRHARRACQAPDWTFYCTLGRPGALDAKTKELVDEVEKGFAAVTQSESDAGLSRRLFGRLLGWLQDRKAPVFVVATSNDIESLPPEMVRKGRFDEIFFVDLPDRDERKEIFTIHLTKRTRDPLHFDLDALAEASDGFSGAEIEQAVVSGLYTAFSGSSDVTTAILVDELRATRPLSVTRREDIAELRAWAADRAVPVR